MNTEENLADLLTKALSGPKRIKFVRMATILGLRTSSGARFIGTHDTETQTNTIIIEADITSSTTKKSNRKIDSHIHHRILTTCGDANAMFGTKHIDPALCLYKGAIVMCIDNKHLKDKVPRGNGTICRVINFKIKQNAPSYKCKNYYGKKVWTVNAIDVEWVECEHVNKTGMMLQLETQIHGYTSQLDLIENKTQIKTNQIQVKIDTLKNRLSTIMKYRKFNQTIYHVTQKNSILL